MLSGQTVLVTGGAIRVGAAISKAVARAGAKVAIHCHSHLEDGQALAQALIREGAQAVAFQADLAAPDGERSLFDRVEGALGPLTGLVNNAGLIAVTPLHDYDAALAQQIHTLNLLVPLRMSAELARRKPSAACIVNIADTASLRAWPGHSAYCASKAGLLAATQVAARELAPHIRVNAVSPGTVILRPEQEARVDQLLARIPLGRIGDPDDVAQAVVYLLSAPYVTGAILAVDGGAGLVA